MLKGLDSKRLPLSYHHKDTIYKNAELTMTQTIEDEDGKLCAVRSSYYFQKSFRGIATGYVHLFLCNIFLS